MAGDDTEHHPADGWSVIPFASQQAFESWLDDHHSEVPGLWLKFAKKNRGIPSIQFPEALEVAAFFGWVDSKLQRYDDDYYLLRDQLRRPKSSWSPRNRALAERLAAAGRMRPAGLAQIEAAKRDGRWGRARSSDRD